MQKLRVKVIKLRIEKDKTQGRIQENSGSKLQNSGFGISPNLVKFSRTAQKKKPAIVQAFFFDHFAKNSGPKKTQGFSKKLRFWAKLRPKSPKNSDFWIPSSRIFDFLLNRL